ncbi:hypothetical protein G7Y79_00018g044610 [Physcia stellaris]|nr:hypothetical protein G7Y79_00018g044610 [Physcia stellaris]
MAPSKKRKAAAVAEAEPASDAIATPPEKRGRGRPSKAEKAEFEQLQAASTPPAKRGRPSKAEKAANEQASAPAPASSSIQKNTTTPTKASAKGKAAADTPLRRSSRHPSGAEETATATPRATRSGNTDTSRAVVAVKETKAKAKAKGDAKTASPKKKAATKSHTRGIAKKKVKPAKGKGKVAPTEVKDEEEDETSSDDDLPEVVHDKDIARGGRKDSNVSVNVQSSKVAREESEDADEEDNDEPSYWLMKAENPLKEPETRMEKGKDVKFSIDDLKNASEPEGWDGVRNPTARNNMRLMVKGDQAFFYHSNCKVPGIAGIMEIVEEHTPDESALDPKHPYYDAKSTAENPKWCKVRVSFRRKFPELVRLKELQKYAKEGGILQNLQTLRQSRLSVSKVSKKEWDFILRLVDDEEEDEKEADDVKASAVDPNTLGAGEGGDADADSAVTAVWTGANGTNGTSNEGNNEAGDP